MAKRLKKQSVPTLMPIDVDVDLIRFERNLLNVGFFAATDPRNELQTIRTFEKEITRDGHKVRVSAEFRGSPKYGLPTTADRDKFIAFLKILNEDKATRGKIVNPVRFSGYRMVQELGLSRNAGIYEDILRWGNRMTETAIQSSQVVFMASKKVYSDDTLHVFNRFKRVGTSNLNGGDRQEGFEVELAEWFLDNLNQRFVVPEDFNAYKQLKRPISKGIFGFLHIAFHASNGRDVEKDYADLCNELGVKSYPHLSRIKATIGLALDELVKINYLSSWEIHAMVTKSGYKVIFKPGSELTRFLNRYQNDRKLLSDSSPPDRVPSEADSVALKKLLDHGVTPEKAKLLVHVYGSERVIDIVDYQETQIFQRKSRIQNPAGLIIFSLENNLPIPSGFITQRRRRDMQDATKAEQERKAQEWEMEQTYKKWVDEALDQAVAARYSATQLRAKVQEVVAERGKTDIFFKRCSLEQREVMALQLIRKEIREQLNVPGFSEWSAGRTQGSLF
jgi:hypothetical protein